ncbi:hypothetical protein BDV59DRAFT_169125 [Aspergillus ambiguus]|uniref:uncharacterized protein n=1 Tax=Aspergillus ambiguus TaxID=176160 RepID=UPI003CCC9FCD
MAATHLSTTSLPGPSLEEVQEYEKILKLSDDIFSGAHPRLKVPQQFVRKPASRVPSSAPQVKPTGLASESSPASLVLSGSSPARLAPTQNVQVVHAAPAAPTRIMSKPTSEIDPIFLTKSDDLVRAELQLHRQRVERALREQLEQKRQESKQKAWVQDPKPDFDVSEVLNKAFEMVKPSPSVEETAGGEPSDSFDDNSFYSSRAPDSPQHGEPQQPPFPARPSNPGALAAAAPPETYPDELQRLEALNRTESDQELLSTYPVADQRLPHPRQRSRHVEADHEASDSYEPAPPAEPLDEPEYSPPAPGVAPMERVDGQEFPEFHRGYTSASRRRPVDGRSLDRVRYTRRSVSAGDDVRIVRNHITSPAAPQPSRVSPLAVTKVASVRQPREVRPEYESERQGSPETVPQQLMPRKRRRVNNGGDRARPASYRMQGTGPDEPYIKEEPVSPPPFADDPQTYRSRQPHERPIYIDIASPYTPAVERREPPREAVYDLDPYEYPEQAGMPRTVSRVSVRRPARDDQDLRRVASLHQARQSEYPRELVEQTSPRSVRAGSYAYVERPPQERVRYYDELPPPPVTRRYVPAGESPPAPRYRDAYYEEAPGRMMAPPRRIIVDEHGNQYYMEPPPSRVQMMPPPAGRLPVPRTEVYDDPVPIRHASVRAASVIDDPYGPRRLVQEVPPPTAYRRVTDYARPPVPGERRAYAPPMEEPYPRSGSVQVGGYPARHPTYVEGSEFPREHLVRMPSVRPTEETSFPREQLVRVSSVRPVDEGKYAREHLVRMPSTRPPTARYEEPPQMMPRVESVRPGGREVSVYMDDDSRRAREYVERPVYVAARPLARDDRYYDGGEGERMVVDESVRRVPPGY